MDPKDYPRVWPNLLPSLEAALVKRQEGISQMADFKKKFNAAKNKAKRAEKYVTTMDEEMRRSNEYYMLDSVRLAENKFIIISKKLKQFKAHEEKYCVQAIKVLKSDIGMEPHQTQWYIQSVASYAQKANSLIRDLADMLRIANGHLKKVDHTKKTIAHYAKLRERLNAYRLANATNPTQPHS